MLGALLFDRLPYAATVTSLDGGIAAALRQTVAMPPTIAAVLQQQVSSVPDGTAVPPSPELQAAGVLATRPTFTVIAPGKTASVPIDRRAGRVCTLHATALSTGATPAGWLRITLLGPGHSRVAPPLRLTFGSVPTVRSVQLSLPARAAVASFSGSSAAMWAEPFETCGPVAH